MNVLAYSPDGQMIATGGDDGKVWLWIWWSHVMYIFIFCTCMLHMDVICMGSSDFMCMKILETICIHYWWYNTDLLGEIVEYN